MDNAVATALNSVDLECKEGIQQNMTLDLTCTISNLNCYIYAVLSHLSSVRLFCDPMDCSSPGSSIHGILQARIPEWVATFSSRGFLYIVLIYFIWSDQMRSVAQSCPTLCDPRNCSMPGLPVHHQLPEFTQTHVHPVSDAIQPSHPLSSPSTPAPNPPSIRVFSN